MLENQEYAVVNNVPMSRWLGPSGCELFLVQTMDEWKAFYELLMQQPVVCVDTETTGFEWYADDHIVGMSFGWGFHHNFYIPVRHEASVTGGEQPPQLNMDDIRADLVEFFSQESVQTVLHNCMHAGSKVRLADGSVMRIDTMVEQKHPGPVLCVNETTGDLEAKPVVGWLKGKLRPNEEWLKVLVRGKGEISCTVDHEILTTRGRVRADEIRSGDRILTSKRKLALARSAILGTLLGDASITKQPGSKARSPHLSYAHHPKDNQYVQFKRECLSDLLPTEPAERKNNRGFSANSDTSLLWVRTRADSRLNEIYDLVCVDGKKSLNEQWIKQIDLAAVGVWYADDGHLEAGRYPIITTLLPPELEDCLVEQLTSIGLMPQVRRIPGQEHVARIRLSTGNPDLVWRRLAPWVPEAMGRKVPEGVRAGEGWIAARLLSDELFADEVVEVLPLFKKNGRRGISRKLNRAREYCIAVEDNHNFFVSSGLSVSNCKFDQHFFKREGIVFKTKIHDTRVRWQFYDENAPGALKTISTGWRDLMGRWHPGLVSKDANDLEKKIDRWRSDEAIARRKQFELAVQLKVAELAADIDYQGKSKVELKRIAKHEKLKDHPFYEAKKDDVHYGYVPISLMTQYAAVDVYLTWVVFMKTEEAVNTTSATKALYENEMELSTVLFDAEEHGVTIRRKFLEQLGKDFDEEIAILEGKIRAVLGDSVNLNSAQQLVAAFQAMGVTLTKTTDSSTDERPVYAMDKEVLEDLATDFQVAKDVLSLRELTKLKSTYVDGILAKIRDHGDHRGWVLHPSFNQNVATGRMSSYDPNCFDGQTEVLTPGGWVRFDEYVPGTVVAQWDNGTISWVTPTGYIAKESSDLVHIKNGHIDLLMTSDHRCLLQNRKSLDWYVVPAKNYSKDALQHHAGLGDTGNQSLTQEQLTLLCAFQADAYVDPYNVVEWGFTKERKIERLLLTLDRLELAYTKTVDSRNRTRIRVKQDELLSLPWLTEYVDENKQFKWSLLNLDKVSREIFIEELFYWDGLSTRRNNYSSNVEHNVDVVQSLCALTGLRAHKRVYYPRPEANPSYQLDITRRSWSQTANAVHTKVTEPTQVYCVSVPSSYLLIRRGADTYVTGNCQNIPGRTKLGKLIRKAFGVPSDEYVYLLVDYSQIEVRLTAHYSQDPLFLDAYAKGQDIHTRTMCEMWNYSYDEVQPVIEQEIESHPMYQEWKLLRNIAKRINFGIIYGVGPDGLSKQVPRPAEFIWTPDCGYTKEELNKAWVAQCRSYIEQYLYKYIGVKRFINRGARHVLKTGVAVNGFGRVRHLPWYNASKFLGDDFRWMEGRAARQGVNFEIQGEAADLFKIAAVRVHRLLKGKKSKLVNFVHDELQIYLHKDELYLLADIREAMQDFPQYTVPIEASFEFSPVSWGDKHKI